MPVPARIQGRPQSRLWRFKEKKNIFLFLFLTTKEKKKKKESLKNNHHHARNAAIIWNRSRSRHYYYLLANIITGEFVNSFPNSFVFCPTLIFISEIRVPGVFLNPRLFVLIRPLITKHLKTKLKNPQITHWQMLTNAPATRFADAVPSVWTRPAPTTASARLATAATQSPNA